MDAVVHAKIAVCDYIGDKNYILDNVIITKMEMDPIRWKAHATLNGRPDRNFVVYHNYNCLVTRIDEYRYIDGKTFTANPDTHTSEDDI